MKSALASVPRGLWMVPACVVLFNLWRGASYPDAHAWNAWGAFGVIVMLFGFRLAKQGAVSIGLLMLIGAIAATMATPDGETSNVARVFIGGLFITAAWAATEEAREPFDWALVAGLWSEAIAWALGNASRGTFGPDVALSAIGQAYGAWSQPAQWGAIAIAYMAATWYNLKANKA